LLGLLISPVIGFLGAMLLLWIMKAVIPNPALYKQPEGDTPPPWPIRALLIFTCTAVSFAHGGNDGQKGMGLIMLILIGVAPTAYALNRTMPDSSTPAFVQTTTAAQAVFRTREAGTTVAPAQARGILEAALRTKKVNAPQVYAALDVDSGDIAQELRSYGSISHVPAAATKNLRNEMYVVSDTLRLLTKDKAAAFPPAGVATIKAYQSLLEKGTRYIPTWVKVSVALALGLGTMVGWKRIVITVGQKIGKTHLTYGMGASAELIAASTILLAEFYGLPVSTTHILSSGVAGTMVADGAGLQASTVRNIAMAWVLTLPAAMAIAGVLYAVFLTVLRMTGSV
jgi:PiT family inorganic phosphate transporter